MNKNTQSCKEINKSGGIGNNQYYTQIGKLTNNQLRAKEVNKFIIDFNLPDKTLINITKPLIPRRHNPELFIFVLETTLETFDNFIKIPDIYTFYKDIMGFSCTYVNGKLNGYNPRLRFKFYNGGKLVYCTVKNDYEGDKNYGSHNSLVFNPAFVNIVKMSDDILIEKYKTNNIFLKEILDNIISLFNIKGKYSVIIAKLLIICLSQEGIAILTPLIMLKLFKTWYGLSNYLTNTIYKRGTKYIIKQPTIIKGSTPVNNVQPEYNNKFNLTYIIDENDPRVIIKMDIGDIDNLLKSYVLNVETHNIRSSHNILPSTNINYKQINFIRY
jgi:hypothetical protein